MQNSQSKTIARAGPNTTDLSRFKEVLLRLISPLRPGLLQPVENEDFRYLVMPIRLNV